MAVVSRFITSPELNVTGVVGVDVARNVPVVPMATGRVVEIRARLGDVVKKGQLLMRVQSADLADAFSDYRQAVADERLANVQLARSKILYDKGAIAQKELEVAQQAEEKADVVVETAIERLKVLGADKDHPTAVVDIMAPVSGVITDQQVTAAAGTQGLGSPGAFTISDLSRVWVVCDVYENDLAFVNLGEEAEIRLNAYPSVVLRGRVSNIGAILDPNLRTAKVRVEVENPGMMRLGMFVQAKFHGQQTQVHGWSRPRQFCIFTTASGCMCQGREHIPSRRSPQRPDDSTRPAGDPIGHPARRPRGRGRVAAREHAGPVKSYMIRTIVDFALNNRFLILAAAALLTVWGVISFRNLPVEAYPDVASNYVEIITQWPGRAAEEVEQQVTIPIEIAVNGIPHLEHLRSITMFGLSTQILIFR